MKKLTLSAGLLVFMLALGGMSYGQTSMDGSWRATDQSSGSGSMGSDQGMRGTSVETRQMGLVDINTASVKELKGVRGISKSIAKNIVKYRDQNGPFTSVDDLINVKGINQKKLNTMRSHLTVGVTRSPQQPMGGNQGGASGMDPGGDDTGGTGGGMGGMGNDN